MMDGLKKITSIRTSIGVAFGLMVVAACNSNPRYDSKVTDSDGTNLCYGYYQAKDTIRLEISVQGDSVAGNLLYQLYEKDANRGKIHGKWHGDTLFARYDFNSEGVESVRDIAFLRNDSTLTEGYGKITEKGGRTTFEDRANIKFTGIVMQQTACP